MPRFFLEVAYKGTRYSGFQIQQNAATIQDEIQKAFTILLRKPVGLTGSSRTDAGVHALQNYFHFDFEDEITAQFLYKINAILPGDIVIKSLHQMHQDAHSRFDALSREYEYRLYAEKDPFIKGLALHYPYTLNMELMQKAAEIVQTQATFSAFCKTNTQVNNFNCHIIKSEWKQMNGTLIYTIEANRFLRGMVRMLTATMLQVGRGKITLESFSNYFDQNDRKSTYSISAAGLFLKSVKYPHNYIPLS